VLTANFVVVVVWSISTPCGIFVKGHKMKIPVKFD